jgi:hypothetical protein
MSRQVEVRMLLDVSDDTLTNVGLNGALDRQVSSLPGLQVQGILVRPYDADGAARNAAIDAADDDD